MNLLQYGSPKYLLRYLLRRMALLVMQLSCVLGGSYACGALEACGSAMLGQIVYYCLNLLGIGIGGLNCFLSHAVIHACAHPKSFSGSRQLDCMIGELLCLENLFSFGSYRTLHRMHHAHTNSRKDPHHVRHGETWLHYILTFQARSFLYAYQDEYSGLRLCQDRQRGGFYGFVRHILLRYQGAFKIIGWILSIIFISFALAGVRGFFLLLVFWFLPMIIGHLLIADFSYRTHVGLPERAECRPYTGQDTHSFSTGWLVRALNWLLFQFYRHRLHHAHPSLTVFGAAQRGARRQGD